MWSMRGKYRILRKVFKCTVHGEYDKVGMFTLHKIVTAENIKLITYNSFCLYFRRMRRKYLIVCGICVESIEF